MAKTKTKKKAAAPKPKAQNDTKKIIMTVEDTPDPSPPAPAPDIDHLKKLKPFIVNAVKSPIQAHIDRLLQSTILAAIQGSEIDPLEVQNALKSVKIGGKTLAEIVDRVKEVEDILKNL